MIGIYGSMPKTAQKDGRRGRVSAALLLCLMVLCLSACPSPVSETPPKVAPPSITPAGAYFNDDQQVSLSGPAGARLFYTMDGSLPSATSQAYTAPFTVTRTLTVKAVAILEEDSSPVASAAFVRALEPLSAPLITPNGGSLSVAALVTILGPGQASIHYTLDGNDPSAASPVYSSPFVVETDKTVKAVAIRDGKLSPITEASFTWTGGPPIARSLWGRWLGIGDSSICYISGSTVSINGIPFAHSQAGENYIELDSGRLEVNADKMLSYSRSGLSVPYYFFQRAGAESAFSLTLAASEENSAALGAKALTSLSGISVVIRNLNNPSDTQTLTSGDNGELTAANTIVGDDYAVVVTTEEDGITRSSETALTPNYSGQSLGKFAVGGTGAKLKINPRPSSRPDLMMADGVTDYPLTLTLSNYGDRAAALSFTLSGGDGLSVITGATGTLGTLGPGESADIELTLRCAPWSGTGDYEDKNLSISLTSETGRVTEDSISIRFVKKLDIFTVAVRPAVKGLIVTPDGLSLRLPEDWAEGGLGSHTRLAKKPGEYLVVLGGEGDGSETAYSLAINALPRWDTASLANTAIGEKNDTPELATHIRLGEAALQFLGAKDVDFYRFVVPIGELSIQSDTERGLKSGPLSVDIQGIYDGETKLEDAELRYTTDFSLPGPNSGTVWNDETINLTEDQALYLYISKDLYEPTLIRFVERERMLPLPAGIFHNGTALVSVSAFSISNVEVSQASWQAIMGNNPSRFVANPDADSCPVESVSWYQAIVYCNKRSAAEGLSPVYSINEVYDTANWTKLPDDGVQDADWNAVVVNETANGYRLPTEAQWEYACRAGTTSGFFWGEARDAAIVGAYAWYADNYEGKSHGAALKAPNPWGLYDMAGNVGEWCWDWYDTYPSEVRFDPSGPAAGTSRVGRAEVWGSSLDSLSSSARNKHNPGDGYFGLRLVRKP